MLLEIVQRAARDRDKIDIRDIGRKDQHQSGSRIKAIEAGLAQHQAGQRVGEIVHAASLTLVGTLAGLRARKLGGTNKVSAWGTISTRAGATPAYSPSTCR